jgi:polar amino acid transport system permease protein
LLSYKFDWSVVTSGQYHDWLVAGLKVTLQLSLAGIILSFLLGLLVAVMRMICPCFISAAQPVL